MVKLLEAAPDAHHVQAVLVAAVFDAFIGVYKARTADLLRVGDSVVVQITKDAIGDTFEGGPFCSDEFVGDPDTRGAGPP